jgi:methyl halide transferase
MKTKEEWDERYISGNTPWELWMARPEVQDLFQRYVAIPSKVLEIGCGVGTHAFWLDTQGYQVTAFDLSDRAIAQAKKRQEALGTHIDFYVKDILKGRDIFDQFPVVFDCAVFNQMQDDDKRYAFVREMALYCEDHAYWINVTPSVEYAKEIMAKTGMSAPPYFSLAQIVQAVDPYFRLIEMSLIPFMIAKQNAGKIEFYAWASVFQKR